jgi:hypothetical protein
MASVLGFDSDLPMVREADRDYRAAMAESIKAIGTQVSGFIKERQTQKQLQAMGTELRGLDLTSDSFPLEAMGIAQKYPLATQSKVGQQTFDLLGLAWKQHNSAVNNRVKATFQDDQGNIYRQYNNGQFDIPPPPGARISRLGSFEDERYDLSKRTAEENLDLRKQNFELQTDKEKRLANEASQRAEINVKKQARQKLLDQQRGELNIENIASGEISKLQRDKDLGLKVWQEGGEWYKANQKQIDEYEEERIIGKFTKEHRTKISKGEADEILSKQQKFVELPKEITNAKERVRQINLMMGQLDQSLDLPQGDAGMMLPDDSLSGPPVLTSKREFDALPSGSVYIRDGKQYRKP